jgi:hypothetical protein
MKKMWTLCGWILLLGVPNAFGAVSMSVAILNMSDGATASSVTWNTANVGVTTWAMANQYLQITSVLSDTNVVDGIQTYTQNSGGLYTGPASSTTAAGLVYIQNPLQTIPLAWEINASTTPPPAGDPNTTFVWFYFQDKGGGSLPNASPTNTYIQVERSGVPPAIQFAQGSFGFGAVTGINNLFLEADFEHAPQGTYQTSTLTLELYTQ